MHREEKQDQSIYNNRSDDKKCADHWKIDYVVVFRPRIASPERKKVILVCMVFILRLELRI